MRPTRSFPLAPRPARSAGDRRIRRSLLALALVLAAWPATAAASDDAVASYAIVVGSNAGGAGQDDLRFAERDARRVADVLTDVGGYDDAQVQIVLAPTPKKLLGAIGKVATRLAEDRAAGRRTLLFFYYSGHARASALVLGDQELSLADLRERITGAAATVTVVVLDACQSGAFTRVKGAEPAADFSFNSRTGLDAAGLAVLASSSESELSQESDFLEGSYFTHHLLVGLRGGGDRDRDGRVSLDEAYRYAYHQTLVATSFTAVGRQHVNLEVELKGQGEIPLSFPEPPDATLALDAELAGDVLVQRGDAVLAEVHKTRGAGFDVAIPHGTYRVLVRTASTVHRCPVEVPAGGTAPVALDRCEEVELIDGSAKRGAAPLAHPWTIELSAAVALLGSPEDDFSAALGELGYQTDGFRDGTALELGRRVLPWLSVVGRLSSLSTETWRYRTELEPIEYTVETRALTAAARVEYPTADVTPWVEAGLGPTWARERFEDEEDRVSHASFWSLHLEAAAGISFFPGFARGAGIDVDVRWLRAPTVDDLQDHTLDVGGVYYGVGVVYRR